MFLYMIYLTIFLLILIIIYMILITPDYTGKQKASFLVGKNIAHRALYNNEKGVAENSIEAAKKSVLCGFGMEFDLQLSSDGEVMVFHDDDLMRMTGKEGSICDYTRRELQEISLLGTNQTIPTLKQYLEIADGKVPLIIEIKGGKQNTLLCETASKILDDYNGNFVVESFYPDILYWFRKNRPNYIRGQLALVMKKNEESFIRRFVLANLLTNCITKPHFIAYNHEDVKNLSFRICRAHGVMTAGWTIDNLSSYKNATTIFDTIIFEKILPANDYMPIKNERPEILKPAKGELSTNSNQQNIDNQK